MQHAKQEMLVDRSVLLAYLVYGLLDYRDCHPGLLLHKQTMSNLIRSPSTPPGCSEVFLESNLLCSRFQWQWPSQYLFTRWLPVVPGGCLQVVPQCNIFLGVRHVGYLQGLVGISRKMAAPLLRVSVKCTHDESVMMRMRLFSNVHYMHTIYK
jgi:hypothetical protein